MRQLILKYTSLLCFSFLALCSSGQTQTFDEGKRLLDEARGGITLLRQFTSYEIERLSPSNASRMKTRFTEYFVVLRQIAFSEQMSNKEKAELLANGMNSVAVQFEILTVPYPDPVPKYESWEKHRRSGYDKSNTRMVFMGSLDRLRYFVQVLGRDIFRYINFTYLKNPHSTGFENIGLKFPDAFPFFGRGTRRTSVVNHIGFETMHTYNLGVKQQNGGKITLSDLRRQWYKKLFVWIFDRWPLSIVSVPTKFIASKVKNGQRRKALEAIQKTRNTGDIQSMALLATIYQMNKMQGAEPLRYGAQHLWATWIQRTAGVMWFLHPVPELVPVLSDWSPMISGIIYLIIGWHILPHSRKMTSGLDFYKQISKIRKLNEKYVTSGQCEKLLSNE